MDSIKKLLISKSFYFCIIFLAIGFFGGIYWNQHQGNSSNQVGKSIQQYIEFRSGEYKLINPLYECSNRENYGVKEFSNLEDNLTKYIDKITLNTSITRVAVYFRDLNNGPWFGINEKDNFAPSSLLKLPVMMAYFQKAEKDPSVLDIKIKYTQDPQGLIPQNYKNPDLLEKGQTYSVEQLIEKMIENSDNVALGLLLNNSDTTGVSNDDIDKITLDLGIPTANDKTPNDFMNVKEYSALFRVLFNSSYLNKEYSEKALEILSKSIFKDGLVNNIPTSIIVAHKFGERDLENQSYQLHDCGIIYFPNRPYLLCVMTKGNNFNKLSSTIEQVSETVYNEMKARYK